MNRKIKHIILLSLFFACSSGINSNTSVTVDYFGIREHTAGMGWDNPLNVERLFLGNSRPLTVIFADPDDPSTKDLVGQIIIRGLKDKVWIIDSQSPVSQLCQVLMNGGNHTPTLVYMNSQDRTLRAEGPDVILKFLEKNEVMLPEISDGKYY